MYKRYRLMNGMTCNVNPKCCKGLISAFWFKINPQFVSARFWKCMDYTKAFAVVFKCWVNMSKIRKILAYNYKMNQFSLPSSFWSNRIVLQIHIVMVRDW